MSSQNETGPDAAPARKWGRTAVMLVVGLAILIWLLTHITFTDFRYAWARVDWAILILGIAVALFTTLVRTLRFAVFFESHGGTARLYGVFALWRFVNMVLPFKTGEVAGLVMLKKYGFVPSIAEAAPTWLVIRVFDLLAIVAWFSVVLLIVGTDLMRQAGMQDTSVILAAIAVVAILGLPAAYWMIAHKPIDRENGSWFGQRVRAFQDGIHRIRSMRKIAVCVGLSIFLWGIAIAMPTTLQFAFGVPLTAKVCLVISMISLVASMLPIHAPLALGTGDLIWVGAFILFGLAETEAIAVAISIRLSLVILFCLEGAIGAAILALRPPPTRR